jgi:GNAT superfamily N-acetyltransferase
MITIQLVSNPSFANEAGLFFAANVDSVYISHGEIIDARAESFDKWSPEIVDIFATDAMEAICNAQSPDADGLHLAALFKDDSLAGLALFEYHSHRSVRTAILQDIVIAKIYRGQSLGTQFLNWLENQFRNIGQVDHIFLESGRNNAEAHRFFKQHGYTVSSVVMTKQTARPTSQT